VGRLGIASHRRRLLAAIDRDADTNDPEVDGLAISTEEETD
jgi:hypothetical protein